MKKIIFLIILTCSSIALVGQNKIKLGINGGLSYTNLRGNDLTESYDAKFSVLAGTSFEYFFYENISLGLNINYESKGVKDNGYLEFTDINGSSEVLQSDSVLNYNYLVLPMYINYYFGTKKDFYVNTGLFAGYLLSANLSSKKFDNKTDVSNSTKKIDGGLQFGFGKTFRFNDKNELKVELRESLGLINISDVKVYDDGTVKTNSLNLILNWNFNL